MREKQRPTAKDVLDGLVQAMHEAQEPLDDDIVLVPSVYDLLLHPEAYQALQPLLPRIQAQAKRRLDRELAYLNSRPRAGMPGLLRRLGMPLLRLFFADWYMRRRVRPVTYERAGDAWHVDVGVTAEPDAGLDYLAVETDFGLQAATVYRGSPTVMVRRRTVILPDGRLETVLTSEQGRVTRRTPRGAGGTASTQVLARLSYEDRRGRHVYYMRKDLIVIGRQDDAGTALDVALDTVPDISREHTRIRHHDGHFVLQNVSRFGATINGEHVAASVGEGEEEPEAWHPLPPHAEIGLAGAVFIHFEALTP